jgi:hypothetical protein
MNTSKQKQKTRFLELNILKIRLFNHLTQAEVYYALKHLQISSIP